MVRRWCIYSHLDILLKLQTKNVLHSIMLNQTLVEQLLCQKYTRKSTVSVYSAARQTKIVFDTTACHSEVGGVGGVQPVACSSSFSFFFHYSLQSLKLILKHIPDNHKVPSLIPWDLCCLTYLSLSSCFLSSFILLLCGKKEKASPCFTH